MVSLGWLPLPLRPAVFYGWAGASPTDLWPYERGQRDAGIHQSVSPSCGSPGMDRARLPDLNTFVEGPGVVCGSCWGGVVAALPLGVQAERVCVVLACRCP